MNKFVAMQIFMNKNVYFLSSLIRLKKYEYLTQTPINKKIREFIP